MKLELLTDWMMVNIKPFILNSDEAHQDYKFILQKEGWDMTEFMILDNNSLFFIPININLKRLGYSTPLKWVLLLTKNRTTYNCAFVWIFKKHIEFELLTKFRIIKRPLSDILYIRSIYTGQLINLNK